MRVPWTARRSNQSILKEISPGCSLEGLMLKLKLHHSDHLMQRSSSHKRLQALVFGILFLSQTHSLCFLEFSSFSPGISQLVHLPSVLWSPPIRTGAPAKPSPPSHYLSHKRPPGLTTSRPCRPPLFFRLCSATFRIPVSQLGTEPTPPASGAWMPGKSHDPSFLFPNPVPCLQSFLTRVRSLGGEDPLEEGRAAHSSVLAWRVPGTGVPGGLQSMGSQRVRHDRAEHRTLHLTLRVASLMVTASLLLLDLNQPFDEACVNPSCSSLPRTVLHHAGPASSS